MGLISQGGVDDYGRILGRPAHGHCAEELRGKVGRPGKERLSAFLASVELRTDAPMTGVALLLCGCSDDRTGNDSNVTDDTTFGLF